MNKEIKAKWVAALRSGEYKQTTDRLRNWNAFCCLGVLCNLHAQAHPEIAEQEKDRGTYLGEDLCLPLKVREWAGLDQAEPVVPYNGLTTNLTHLNDGVKLTFPQIADVIEVGL